MQQFKSIKENSIGMKFFHPLRFISGPCWRNNVTRENRIVFYDMDHEKF